MSAPQSVPPVPFTAKALYNFVGNHEDELQFKKGDCLTVLQVVDGGWWEGQLQIPGAQQGTGPIGWFPANHIKIVASDVTSKEPSPLSALHAHSESSSSNKQASDTPKTSHKTSHYSLGLYSLLESQIRFEECLNNLLEKSLIPLGNSNILSAKDYDILCCNLHEITQLVKSLTKELTEACRVASNSREQQKFGRQYCSFITRYRQLLLVYCANHPAAVRVISNHSSQLDSFAKASRSSLGSASPSQSTNSGTTTTGGYTGTILDLTAAFSQPFRQVETYSAILREIKASVSDSHPDYNQITEAIRMSDNLVNELEEIRGLKEKELEMLSARIDNWPLSLPPFTPTGGNHDQGTIAQLSTLGPLIQMAPVWTYKPSSQGGGLTESYILMFNDYVVILEHTFDPRCYKCQHLIEMHELVAHAKDASSSEQKANPSSPKYPLVLIDREGERYQVLFKLNQLRAFWVKLIGDQSSQAMRGGAASAGAAVPAYPHSKGHHQGASHQFSAGASGRLRASTATSASSSVSPQPSVASHQHHHNHQHHSSQGVSRPPPFMRTERSMPGMSGSGGSGGGGSGGVRSTNAVTTGGFDITQLRPNPPMTPSELILCSRHSSDSVKSPKVSRKKSNRKSEKIRAEELAELNSRKTLDCRSLDHDAKIFEVIEAYCQSSQNRMTLHSVADVKRLQQQREKQQQLSYLTSIKSNIPPPQLPVMQPPLVVPKTPKAFHQNQPQIRNSLKQTQEPLRASNRFQAINPPVNSLVINRNNLRRSTDAKSGKSSKPLPYCVTPIQRYIGHASKGTTTSIAVNDSSGMIKRALTPITPNNLNVKKMTQSNKSLQGGNDYSRKLSPKATKVDHYSKDFRGSQPIMSSQHIIMQSVSWFHHQRSFSSNSEESSSPEPHSRYLPNSDETITKQPLSTSRLNVTQSRSVVLQSAENVNYFEMDVSSDRGSLMRSMSALSELKSGGKTNQHHRTNLSSLDSSSCNIDPNIDSYYVSMLESVTNSSFSSANCKSAQLNHPAYAGHLFSHKSDSCIANVDTSLAENSSCFNHSRFHSRVAFNDDDGVQGGMNVGDVNAFSNNAYLL